MKDYRLQYKRVNWSKILLVMVCVWLSLVLGAWLFWNLVFIPSLDKLPREIK